MKDVVMTDVFILVTGEKVFCYHEVYNCGEICDKIKCNMMDKIYEKFGLSKHKYYMLIIDHYL